MFAAAEMMRAEHEGFALDEDPLFQLSELANMSATGKDIHLLTDPSNCVGHALRSYGCMMFDRLASQAYAGNEQDDIEVGMFLSWWDLLSVEYTYSCQALACIDKAYCRRSDCDWTFVDAERPLHH